MNIKFAMVSLLVVLLSAGCEKATTSVALEVTPESAEIDIRGTVVFTASIPEAERETRQLYYPLVWQVRNETLGTLQETVGDTAVYVAGDNTGVNTVIVRDQSGLEGVASVTQSVPEETVE